MTELSCMVFLTDPSRVSLLDDHTSVGTLLPHSYARVVDSKLNVLPAGVPGELLIFGYLVFKGYYKNPAKTDQALVRDAQGRAWLRTGDLVSINAAGRCTIRGRVKDMIKRGRPGLRHQLHDVNFTDKKTTQAERTSSQQMSRQLWRNTLVLLRLLALAFPMSTGVKLWACLSSVSLEANLAKESSSFGSETRLLLIRCQNSSFGSEMEVASRTSCLSITQAS